MFNLFNSTTKKSKKADDKFVGKFVVQLNSVKCNLSDIKNVE